MDAAFGLGIAIGILALDQDRRALDAGLLARLVFDRLDLEAALFRPPRVHAEQHFSPVLAFGATRPGMDFDIGVVAISLARQQGLDLVLVGAVGQLGERFEAFLDSRFVVLHLTQFDELDRIGLLRRDILDRADRGLKPAAFLHYRLGFLGIIPQLGILDPSIQLVEPAQRAVPVQELADEGQGGVDPVDMGLPFGTHGSSTPYFQVLGPVCGPD